MRVLITGADGFIARNLLLHFREMNTIECVSFTRDNSVDELTDLLEPTPWPPLMLIADVALEGFPEHRRNQTKRFELL